MKTFSPLFQLPLKHMACRIILYSQDAGCYKPLMKLFTLLYCQILPFCSRSRFIFPGAYRTFSYACSTISSNFISYLDLLLISPPLFSIGDLPVSPSLRDTSTRHHSLFSLHYLSYLISHGGLFTLPLECPFLPSPMATALH